MCTRSFFSLNKSDIWQKDFFFFFIPMSVHFLLLLSAHVHVSPPLSLKLLRAAVGFLISSSEVSSSVSASEVKSRSSARSGSPYLPPSNSCSAVGQVLFQLPSDSSQTGSTVCHHPVKIINLQNVKLKKFEVTRRILKRQT